MENLTKEASESLWKINQNYLNVTQFVYDLYGFTGHDDLVYEAIIFQSIACDCEVRSFYFDPEDKEWHDTHEDWTDEEIGKAFSPASAQK